MVYELAYVQIEGTWHEVAADETTACGLVIPYPGTLLTRELPEKVHCGENATKATATPKVTTKVTYKTGDTLQRKPAKPAAKKK